MPSPGEVAAQIGVRARRSLISLSESQLSELKDVYAKLAENPVYGFVDEEMSRLTVKGKLEMIDQALKNYQR